MEQNIYIIKYKSARYKFPPYIVAVESVAVDPGEFWVLAQEEAAEEVAVEETKKAEKE